MADEWGPWIEHDGRGCPVKGQYVHVINNTGFGVKEWFGVAGSQGGRSWHWARGFAPVIRYRIRKPRGLTILEEILTDLPEKVDA